MQPQAPAPGELAQRGYALLTPPKPVVMTAPPRGRPGLVGLPQWVWLPRSQWQPVKKRMTAGDVWAEITASPQHITVVPGDGRPGVRCPGPGTPYDKGRAANAQRTDCSVTYERSSAGRPNSAYSVTVTVLWDATWVGSGGTGGALPAIPVSTTFPLRIAEGQSVN